MNQENSSGAQAARSGLPTAAKVVIILVALLAALFAAYAALCSWVGDRIPEGTVVELQPSGQTVSLGGLSAQEAADVLSRSIQPDGTYALSVYCAGGRATVDGSAFEADPDAMLATLDQAVGLASSRPFLSRGFYYLTEQSGGGDGPSLELPCTYRYRGEGETGLEQTLSELAQSAWVPPVDPSYEVGEDSIQVTTGTPGAALNVDDARASILMAYNTRTPELYLTTEEVAPAALDAQVLNEQVYIAPVPVGVDADGKTTPPVMGVSIDVDAAQEALNAAAAGETLTFPLVYSQPDYTQAGEDGLLYQDLLSQCVTTISGSAGRLNNVTLAAEKCNGYVLLPGDVFDYNKTVGQRTTAAGFSPAPAYVGGQTVNEIGGGICQVSSSIYYCTVYANLQVLSRINHRYAVGYVPDGLDATVSWGGPEYRFQNDTDYPIKIVAYVSGRTLTVQFYGTDPDGTYVTTERTQLSSSGYETVYKPDESVPQGTTKVDVTPYSGRKVVVYRCVYAADGTLISRTLENTSDYKSRDKVILYNPADAASLGLSPETPPPAETETPGETPPPEESVPPAPEADPPTDPGPSQGDPEPGPSEPDPFRDPLVDFSPAPGGVPMD